MGLKRNVSLDSALRYRGQGPMLTFILHRIGGIGMAVFITMHILASFLGGSIGGFLNNVYEHWLFQIFIFFCVLFHAINGLRITILDLSPKLIEHYRTAINIEWVVYAVVAVFALFVVLRSAFGG